MVEYMASFSEPTRRWFTRVFGAPTEAQTLAWPAIAGGGDVLVIAPTGSGKTLAAFLAAIDRVIAGMAAREGTPPHGESAAKPAGRRGKAKRGVRILYISPLKALEIGRASCRERV